MKTLTQFTDPAILQAIGHLRIAMLLDGFSNDFRAANVVLPTPPDLTCANPGPAGGDYANSVAAILSSPDLPERLHNALFALEAAAAPQNQALLQATIQRRIPGVTLTGLCPLDCALELWFTVPEELSQFSTQASLARPADQSRHSLLAEAEVERRRKPGEAGLAAPLIENHPAQNGTKIKNGEDNGEPLPIHKPVLHSASDEGGSNNPSIHSTPPITN